MSVVILVGLLVTALTAVPVVLQLRKHPRGLVVLFFAEMWERFSFYGMRALLFFYLTQHLLYADAFAQSQYGAYTSLVYLLPLIGGYVADRYLGTRKAIAFGALLLVAGHLLMAVEQQPAVQTLSYSGETYRFEAEGRMESREARLVVDGGAYAYEATEDGGLVLLGLQEGASLPPVLAPGSFELGVEGREPAFIAIFYLALALIATGVGFLKPNISTIVGQLYPEGDPRRDSGFTLYYYGINLGAFWSAILCGALAMEVGWWAGFGLAGIGMLAGFVVFVAGKPLLEGKGEPPAPEALRAPALGPLNREWSIYALSLIGVGLVWALMQPLPAPVTAALGAIVNAAVGWLGLGGEPQAHIHIGILLAFGSIAVLGYLAAFMARSCTAAERSRMTLALILVGGSVVFWTLFEQAGSSLNAFAARNTDLRLWPTETVALGPLTVDMSFGAAQAQSFNSGFILLFAPIFAGLWAFLERRRLDPNDSLKFGLALVQVGAGFLVLVFGARFAGPDFQVPLIFLALAYLLHTTGELFLSPVGLSMITKLSAAAVVSTMMAVWFLSSAWAQWIGAIIAAQTATETIAGQVLDPGRALAVSVGVFQSIGVFAIGVGLVLAIVSPWLDRMKRTSG